MIEKAQLTTGIRQHISIWPSAAQMFAKSVPLAGRVGAVQRSISVCLLYRIDERLTVGAVEVCNAQNVHRAALSSAGRAEGCLTLHDSGRNSSDAGSKAEKGDE